MNRINWEALLERIDERILMYERIRGWVRTGQNGTISPVVVPEHTHDFVCDCGVPDPYVYLVDADGAYLTDADGAYLYEAA